MIERFVIEKSTLSDIAQAIRDKLYSVEEIQVSNFADKIREIDTSGSPIFQNAKMNIGFGTTQPTDNTQLWIPREENKVEIRYGHWGTNDIYPYMNIPYTISSTTNIPYNISPIMTYVGHNRFVYQYPAYNCYLIDIGATRTTKIELGNYNHMFYYDESDDELFWAYTSNTDFIINKLNLDTMESEELYRYNVGAYRPLYFTKHNGDFYWVTIYMFSGYGNLYIYKTNNISSTPEVLYNQRIDTTPSKMVCWSGSICRDRRNIYFFSPNFDEPQVYKYSFNELNVTAMPVTISELEATSRPVIAANNSSIYISVNSSQIYELDIASGEVSIINTNLNTNPTFFVVRSESRLVFGTKNSSDLFCFDVNIPLESGHYLLECYNNLGVEIKIVNAYNLVIPLRINNVWIGNEKGYAEKINAYYYDSYDKAWESI